MENEKTISFRVNKNGVPLKDVENCERVFLNDPDLKGKFRYNEREDCIYKFGALPWDDETEERRFRDPVDLDYLRSYFSHYQLDCKLVENALRIAADKNSYDPLREYFEGLEGKHDGTERAERLFIDCLGAEDTFYTREVTKLFLKACIARTIHPGCKYDYMIILVGDQGIGKSSLLLKICPDIKYYTDSIPHFKKDKLFVEAIEGKLICETAELVGLNKCEIEDMKATISSQVDRTRSAYAHKTLDFPRRCVFVGTTNLDEYLRDATGNRRFLPIKCDISRKARDIWADDFSEYKGQIWAEAYNLFKDMEKTGGSLVLPPEAQEVAKIEQSNAMEKDEWHTLIDQYLCNEIKRVCANKPDNELVSIDTSINDIYLNAINGDAKNIDTKVSRRIGEYFRLHPEYKKQSTVRVKGKQGRGYRLSDTVGNLKLKVQGIPGGFTVLSGKEATEIEKVFLN